MTPEEQEVYAWMGISPLVLSQQEVKNPKSALISVVLPGQAPPPQIVLASEPANDDSSMDDNDDEIAPIAAMKITVEEMEMPPAEEVEDSEPSEPEPVDNGTPRRRRRRSSASATE
jgi:ribonuclease E